MTRRIRLPSTVNRPRGGKSGLTPKAREIPERTRAAVITNKQIREYRDGLPLIPFDYDTQRTIKIALGKLMPYEGMSQQQAREWVERARSKR